MQTKDRRYATCRSLIKCGEITVFREIFDTIPKSIVALDLGKHNIAFTRLINNTQLLRLVDISKMASLLEIDDRVMLELIMKQSDADLKR